jgi:hypothetical protein
VAHILRTVAKNNERTVGGGNQAALVVETAGVSFPRDCLTSDQ